MDSYLSTMTVLFSPALPGLALEMACKVEDSFVKCGLLCFRQDLRGLRYQRGIQVNYKEILPWRVDSS